ncbi:MULTISPECIES: hypothetical protein [unclassified Capnocytophaga]|uniref:hypothetical protein n=1 Tax=unclassified Capnocytophaga TaxID=2640652 RepID=UPI00034E4F8B|nr:MULTISPECIES: hypothetical protein [unclassified Capnocytophaga]AVM55533.1 hypothetical protein C3V44_07825 [Capnocytophaga sp. oral taxon 864]EPE01589.1 hypothetical protein HMPREF1528_00422 [Capnocytophaga sp. oral taxon 336 str. F0502]
MNSIIILIFVLVVVSVYFIVQYKSNFEKRLAYHTPRLLSSERREYIKGAERYIKKASVVIGLFVSFPLMVICAFLLADVGIPIIFLLLIFLIAIECLAIYLLYRILKRNIKNQQALLEQMSDSDFRLLQSVQKELFLFKYFPPFILCKDKLYLFVSLTVEEIDPTTIKEVSFVYARGGRLFLHIKSIKSIRITMYRNIYPLLVEIIEKYNPNAQIKTLK